MAFLRLGLGIGIAPPAGSGTPATAIPSPLAAPSISGPATVGGTLTGDNGNWSQFPTGYAYKWQTSANGTTGWSDIAGQTGASYVVAVGQLAKYIRRGVRASNIIGDALAYEFSASSAVIAAAVSISGTPATTGTVGGTYSFTPTIGGGHGPYTASLSGSLTGSGLSFNTTTGALTATTLGAAGTYGPYTITGIDVDGLTADLAAFSITVSAGSGEGQLDFSDPDQSGFIPTL